MHGEVIQPLWIVPFVTLLGAIAFMPLANPHWWEKKYPFVAIALGLFVALSYVFYFREPDTVVHALHEYFSFITLIGALFIVAGGIHVEVKGHSSPLMNCIFLAAGSALASVIGTTGASMVMIRPWIRMNRPWVRPFHIIFFIFLVSNIGGALTPVGDPPLFLGFLRGVPFFWTARHLLSEWALAILWILSVFYVLDRRARRGKRPEEGPKTRLQFAVRGRRNIVSLAAVVGAAFLSKPLFLREGIMMAAAFAAWRITPKAIHKENNFIMAPFKEVLILFFGIFMTMLPALEWLEAQAPSLGISNSMRFFWGSGVMSSFLDNAPTYLNFLSVAAGLYAPGAAEAGKVAYLLARHPEIIKAISLGCVFFGAMTYIGNGPNFLVKSVAEHEKIKMASFFGYVIRYSIPVLLPLFALISWFSL